MKTIINRFTLLSTLIGFVFIQTTHAQSFDNIANAIKNGNSAELATSFVGNVEITIKNNSDSYRKSQAEMVLKSFFNENKPSGFSISHQGTSPEGSRYFIGSLTTSSGIFRTYVYAKATGNTLVIQEIRFEDKYLLVISQHKKSGTDNSSAFFMRLLKITYFAQTETKIMKGNSALIIQEALKEDIIDFNGQILPGDHTALACIPNHQEGKAKLICKAEGILAGVELAEEICRQVDDTLRLEIFLKDGAKIKHGDIAFHLFGEVKSILRAERVILNFMQRMSGIATNTARYVDLVKGTKAKILDTRKTTPALRYFEKWAVAIGGGHNHRFGLYDRIMMKDNHVDFCGGIALAIEAVRQYQLANNLQLPVEIETRNLAEIEQVLAVGNVDRIMFDNFSVETMKEAVKLVNGRFETEASGGITLETVRTYAETGVDFISVGALTHNSGSLDLSLKAF